MKNEKKAQPRVCVDSADFVSDAETADGRKWNLKIASWNINGIRAWLEVRFSNSVAYQCATACCNIHTSVWVY